ncbi:MAG: hypothetical protein HGA49_09335 [Eubacteriaceae bacterium]|nr:hypothetical protein [Eubacteriaceae bacterium]
MKKVLIFAASLTAVFLMVMGMLYIIQKKQDEKIGGRLVKVDYKFSKEFNH